MYTPMATTPPMKSQGASPSIVLSFVWSGEQTMNLRLLGGAQAYLHYTISAWFILLHCEGFVKFTLKEPTDSFNYKQSHNQE